jgi:hypothetical protein
MTQNHGATPMESPDPPDLNALVSLIGALRQEITALNALLRELRPGLEGLASALETRSAAEPKQPSVSPPLPSQPATSALLARRNAERLNAEVLRRSARGINPDNDTELDLLIDRLHELSEESP